MSAAAEPAYVMNTKPLFKLMVERKASDLFFSCNAPIKIKIDGKILPSILIFTGALQVKNRSEAFFSTMSLNSGLVFIG